MDARPLAAGHLRIDWLLPFPREADVQCRGLVAAHLDLGRGRHEAVLPNLDVVHPLEDLDDEAILSNWAAPISPSIDTRASSGWTRMASAPNLVAIWGWTSVVPRGTDGPCGWKSDARCGGGGGGGSSGTGRGSFASPGASGTIVWRI